MRVLAQSLSESSPSLACRGPLVTMLFLSVFSDSFPKKESWRINCHTGPSCLCGGRNFCSTPLSGARESRKRSQVRQAPRGRPPSEGAVRPCSAAVLPFLTSGVWGTETLGYLYSCSCAIREAAAPAGQPPSSRLHPCCSDYISNKKNLLTMQVGSCIPLPVSLALPYST